MTNVTCNQCGTINLVAAEVCRVCSAELRSAARQHEMNEDEPNPRLVANQVPRFTDASDAIGPTFHLFRKNLWLIAKIVFVIVAPLEILKALSFHQENFDWQLPLGLFMLQLIGNFLIAPALFYSLLKVMQTGNAPSLNEAYRWSLSKLPKLAVAAVVSWILMGLGYVLFIIPGIILSLVFAVVYPVAIFEKGSAIDALRRSAQLTKGNRWSIFLASFVIFILVAIINGIFSGAGSVLLLNGIALWPFDVLIAVVTDVFSEAFTVLSFVIYLGMLRTLETGQSVIE